MKIAVEGCAHGELEKIYETIQNIEKSENIKIDLLLCCGDFQSTRNLDDLQTMAVPKKYQHMCTFYKYYSGEKIAPILTIFIGGNHEASNYLQELPYGGWVAPNIYYMGYSGVVKVNGIRIGGLSGIYKHHDYLRGRFEFSPYSESEKKSVYHQRSIDAFRLKQLSGKMDIFMSHDWPNGIHQFGDTKQLIRFKPFLRDDIESAKLGSKPCEDLLHKLKPSLWFAAHLHCKFAAIVPHADDSDGGCDKITKFLALDKCLPKRRFLQVLDIDSEYPDDAEIQFEYDLEWITILSLTNHLISAKSSMNYMPSQNSPGERFNFTPTDEELENVRKKFDYDIKIPKNFCRTVPSYNPKEMQSNNAHQPKAQINPQSTQFCERLGIDDPLSLAIIFSGQELSHSNILLDESDLNDSSLIQSSFNSSCCGDVQSPPCKRKSGLNLPKPIAADNTCEEEINVSAPLINPEEVNTSENGDSEKEIVQIVQTSNSNPPIKKFKRRNEEMYKEQVDEEVTATL